MGQFGYTQLLADAFCREVGYLSVTGHRGTMLRCRILPDGMFFPLSHELTAVLTQVAQQVTSLHEAEAWGTTRTCDAAVNSKWMGSSRSASGSVRDGSGRGSGSP
jgi:hypothetical protein